MSATILVALVFAVLLGLEWRYRLRSLRIAIVGLAVIVWLIAQPGYTRAARSALMMPRAERVTHEFNGAPFSEYVTGVRTMERAFVQDAEMGASARRITLLVLLWLALSPVAWRDRRPSSEGVSEPESQGGRPDDSSSNVA